MLLRAYRLTDKFGLLFVKSGAALGTRFADGVLTLLGTADGSRPGLLGLLVGLLALIWRGIRAVGVGVLSLLALIGMLLRRVMVGVGRGGAVVAGGIGKVSGRTAGAARASVGDSMARRAARTQAYEEMEINRVVEDPLKVQNRVLGLLFVVTLVGLIGVVIWATQPRETTGIAATGNIGSIVDPVSVAAATNVPVTPNEGASGVVLDPATPIPTATQLPQALESRGTIAYTLRDNGQTDLWVLSVTSGRSLRITNDAASERDPAWLPGTLQLAYASNKDGNWEIYIYDLMTGETTRNTAGLTFDNGPSWSPDGRWLAYESYQNDNLDVLVLPVTDVNASLQAITTHPSADFSPAWSPQGREIAFVSWRDGNQDVYVFSFDTPDQPAINITRTDVRQEDHPAWHPDGDLITFSALDQGIEKVFIKSVRDPDSPAQLIGLGRTPSWSPDGNSIVAAVDSLEGTHLTVYPSPLGDVVGTPPIFAVPANASQPVWTDQPIPIALVNSGGLAAGSDELFVEQVVRYDNEDAPYKLDILTNDVNAPFPSLSDRVNDSFNALRQTTLETSGRDFLGQLDDAFWPSDYRPQPGEEQCNWHMAGRAFSINRNAAIVGFPPAIEVVREDRDLNTYWRVYVRVAEESQSGQLGEPLRQIPWDFNSRTSGDVEAYEQGGRLKDQIPEGYFIDLSTLAADYGWLPYPAGREWRANINAVNYWMFHKPDGLSWVDAMLEIYAPSQLGNCLPAQPTPQPSVSDENTEG